MSNSGFQTVEFGIAAAGAERPNACAQGPALRISKVCAYALMAPTGAVVSSFGARSERGALLIGLQTPQGVTGWGEVWCGMPASGALHRLALLREFVAPRLAGAWVQDIGDCVQALAASLAPVATLAGEPGPVAQVLAGIDSALWDLRARMAGVPLYQLLGGKRQPMRCYASGIAPDASGAYLDSLRRQGYQAFKFKAGFDDARTLPWLACQRQALQAGEHMMIDANCAWDLASALAAVNSLNQLDLQWIEEPMAPHRPDNEWQQLSHASRNRLAGGENFFARSDFTRACAWLGVVQPDVAKWGGVSGALRVGQALEPGAQQLCPHSFGTHIAAMASAHVLAALGGEGYLELDVNDNPLRDSASYSSAIADGRLTLTDAPGIGVDWDVARHSAYVRDSFEMLAPS